MGKRSREKRERHLAKSNIDPATSPKVNHSKWWLMWFNKSNGNLPDIKAEAKRLFYRIFGWPGLVLMFIGSVVLTVLWNWEHARTLPLLGPILHWATQEPIPRADATRFSIAVAHLYGDTRENSNKLVLMEGLKGGTGNSGSSSR
jgi:hypothetical protein